MEQCLFSAAHVWTFPTRPGDGENCPQSLMNKKSSSDFVSITHDKWFQEICQLFLFLTRLEGYNRWMMDDHLHDIKYDKFHENNFRAAFFDWM